MGPKAKLVLMEMAPRRKNDHSMTPTPPSSSWYGAATFLITSSCLSDDLTIAHAAALESQLSGDWSWSIEGMAGTCSVCWSQ